MKLIHFTNFFPYPGLFLKFSLLIVGRCKKHHILELILSNVCSHENLLFPLQHFVATFNQGQGIRILFTFL